MAQSHKLNFVSLLAQRRHVQLGTVTVVDGLSSPLRRAARRGDRAGRRPVAADGRDLRRLGLLAEEFGLPRPSYVHMRRYVAEHRERVEAARARRQAVREILFEAYWDATMGKLVDAYEVAGRLREAGRSI